MPDPKKIDLSAGDVQSSPVDLSAGDVEQQQAPSWTDKTINFVEDVGYPTVGAAAGGIIGAAGGPPGIIAGASLGAAGATSLKHIVRDLQHRNPAAPLDRVLDMAESALMGPVQEAKAIKMATGMGKAALATSEAARLSKEFAVPLSKGQLKGTGSTIVKIEDWVRMSLGGSSVFKKFDQKVNERLITGAEEIANEIGGKIGSQSAHGADIVAMVKAADSAAGKAYEDALVQLSRDGARDVPILVRGRLQDAEKKFVSELEITPEFSGGLKDVQGRQLAINILKNFENAYTKEGTLRSLPWEEARKIRSQIRALTESGEVTIGKGALKQFNHELDAAMRDALGKVGRTDLADSFSNASSNYRRVQELLEHSTIKKLAATDTPESIADILLSKGSETSAGKLRQLIGGDNMRTIERAVWERTYQKIAGGNDGILVGRSLKKAFDGLGPEAQQAIWGSRPEMLSKIKRFIALADTANLRLPTSHIGLPIAQGAGMVHYAERAMSSVLTLDTQGAIIHAGSGALLIITPTVMAKFMTNPEALDVMIKALTTPASTRFGLGLAQRLMYMASMQASKRGVELMASHEPTQ